MKGGKPRTTFKRLSKREFASIPAIYSLKKNSIPGSNCERASDPYINPLLSPDVVGVLGKEIRLNCHVTNLGNKTVGPPKRHNTCILYSLAINFAV